MSHGIARATLRTPVGGRGRPGAPKVRAVLANTRPGPLDSKLEGRAWRMLRPSSLAEPVRQLRVDVARPTLVPDRLRLAGVARRRRSGGVRVARQSRTVEGRQDPCRRAWSGSAGASSSSPGTTSPSGGRRRSTGSRWHSPSAPASSLVPDPRPLSVRPPPRWLERTVDGDGAAGQSVTWARSAPTVAWSRGMCANGSYW